MERTIPESASMTSRMPGPAQSVGAEPRSNSEGLICQLCEICGLWSANPLRYLQTLVSASKALQPPQIERTVEKWSSGAESGCVLCGLIIKLCQDIQKYRGHRYPDLVQFKASPKRNDFPQYLRIMGCETRRKIRDELWEVELYATKDTLNPIVGLPLRRHLPLNFGSKQCLDLVQHWLDECKTQHDNPTCRMQNKPHLPTRILDIRPINPKLLTTNNECDYFVALSHCWGNPVNSVMPLKTLRSNLNDHSSSGVPEACLSTSFRDAIKVTKHLGYRYLWIDSLCIIQDDIEDWERESALMAVVYSNADVVIGATSASNGSLGFLGRRPEYFEDIADFAAGPGARSISWVACYRSSLPHNPYVTNREAFRPAKEGPLESRAWAYQERVLARRFVSFGTYEVTWECTSGLECECFTSYECQSHSEIFTSRTIVPAPRKYNLRRKLGQQINSERLLGAWRKNVVEPYTKRQLTMSSDKLVALAAIAFEFSKKLPDQYLAGIWRGDLERRGLLWHCIELSNAIMLGAPSWSWASIQGSVTNLRMKNLDLSNCPKVIAVKYSAPASNTFGCPHSASIMLRAKVMDEVKLSRHLVLGAQGCANITFKLRLPVGKATVLHMDADVEPMMILKEDRSVLISARRRRGEINDTTKEPERCTYGGLRCLLVASPVALLLGRTSSKSGIFERLGLCVLFGTDANSGRMTDVEIC